MTVPWLPPTVTLPPAIPDACGQLLTIFDNDFVKAPCTFEGSPIRWDRQQQALGGAWYERGFLHLITRRDQRTKQWHFDPLRAMRLPWCRAILDHTHDPALSVWSEHGPRSNIRAYLWLVAHDYVVVLEYRHLPVRNSNPPRTREVVWLVTAFFVDGDAGRRKLRRQYERRIK